jgi:hypothetical protein
VLNIINVPDNKEHFDMDSFISSHRNWAYRDGEEFLYLGDDHWAYICRTGEDGVPYENTDFRRWRVNVSKIDEKSCVSYTTDWDWESLSMVKTEAVTRFVKKGDQYVLEVYERDHPNLIKRYTYAEPDKVNVNGSDDMKAVLGLSLQEIIEKHNTYRLYDDAPVYDDFSRIVFEPGGKGIIYKGKEKHPFTYKFNEEVTDNSISITGALEQILMTAGVGTRAFEKVFEIIHLFRIGFSRKHQWHPTESKIFTPAFIFISTSSIIEFRKR